MIKLYRKYKTLRNLRSIRDKFEFNGEHFHYSDDWLRRVKTVIKYFDNNAEMRKIVADTLRKFREKCPYEPQYTESRKLYEEYFKMKNHIPNFDDLKVGDYVVKFRSEAPVKGDRYAEYYTNSGWPSNLGTSKIIRENTNYRYLTFEVDANGEGISEDFYTSFRYATEEEIQQYNTDLYNYRRLEFLIEYYYKEITKLQKKKRKIF